MFNIRGACIRRITVDALTLSLSGSMLLYRTLNRNRHDMVRLNVKLVNGTAQGQVKTRILILSFLWNNKFNYQLC